MQRANTVHLSSVADESHVAQAGSELEAIERGQHASQLEAFVQFCADPARDRDGDDAWQTLTFATFPTKYSFDKQGRGKSRRHVWVLRQGPGKPSLGRIYPVHPNNSQGSELFYLRLLLHHLTGSQVQLLAGHVAKPSCTSSSLPTCLRCSSRTTFDTPVQVYRLTRAGNERGIECLKGDHETYKEHCQALDLLQNDGEWDETLQTVSRTASARQIFELYVWIFQHCHPASPADLFNKHVVGMAFHYKRAFRVLHPAAPDERLDGWARACVVDDLRSELLSGLPGSQQTEDGEAPGNAPVACRPSELLAELGEPTDQDMLMVTQIRRSLPKVLLNDISFDPVEERALYEQRKLLIDKVRCAVRSC